MTKKSISKLVRTSLAICCIGGGLVSATGCQVSVAGQTLPSPYYLKDDIQFAPAGPRNKLALETAELKKQRAERAAAGF